ncbi:hypothetical protein FDUTEX481_01399 [Tolypothrix sp. PCC 7601]|nr:hypothetical protein FDUTEX481_01399 [Tolypothrix sp. PCC 7601]
MQNYTGSSAIDQLNFTDKLQNLYYLSLKIFVKPLSRTDITRWRVSIHIQRRMRQ